MQGVLVEWKTCSGQCMAVFPDGKIRKERMGAGSQWVERELGIRKGFIFMKATLIYLLSAKHIIFTQKVEGNLFLLMITKCQFQMFSGYLINSYNSAKTVAKHPFVIDITDSWKLNIFQEAT